MKGGTFICWLAMGCATTAVGDQYLAPSLSPKHARALAMAVGSVVAAQVEGEIRVDERDTFGRTIAADLRRRGLHVGGSNSGYYRLSYVVDVLPQGDVAVRLQVRGKELTRVYRRVDAGVRAVAAWVER